MSGTEENWELPESLRPRPEDLGYDLDRALSAVLSLRANVPEDAYTAATLGTERIGNAALIHGDGLLLTIGYLITEAEEIWLTTSGGRVVPGHALGFDGESGLGLVQALGRLDLPPLALAPPGTPIAMPGEDVVMAAGGGRAHAASARVSGRAEFAGYWEYLLEDAIFTAPSHPRWSGAALIGADGRLAGIGSLQLGGEDVPSSAGGRTRKGARRAEPMNMSVPANLVTPVLEDLMTIGRPSRPARPWLGLFAAEGNNRIEVLGLAGDGPGRRAGLRAGDSLLAVAGRPVSAMPDFLRAVWALGAAGVDVPLTVNREGDVFDLVIASADRRRFLKTARLH